MPRDVMCNSLLYALLNRHARAQLKYAVSVERGMGMLEYLLALLIFSTGVMGLMSVQLTAKKIVSEASQRSTATALGRDIVERMRANPEQHEAYRAVEIGDTTQLLPLPDVDCNVSICTAPQIATFDLWQWESRLLGRAVVGSSANSGGLISPRACISNNDGAVAVTISWGVSTVVQQSMLMVCGTEGFRANMIQHTALDYSVRRRRLFLSTYIGSR
ncbi:MAG: type IV pilus modification protein PilV [Halioglobus sp.]|nr:type IV pilus modification protein PilV [Halioglobus sp.]